MPNVNVEGQKGQKNVLAFDGESRKHDPSPAQTNTNMKKKLQASSSSSFNSISWLPGPFPTNHPRQSCGLSVIMRLKTFSDN